MGNCLCEDDVTVSGSQFARQMNNAGVVVQPPPNVPTTPQPYGYNYQGTPIMQPQGIPTMQQVPSRMGGTIVNAQVRDSVYPTNYSRIPTEGRGGAPLQSHFKKTESFTVLPEKNLDIESVRNESMISQTIFGPQDDIIGRKSHYSSVPFKSQFSGSNPSTLKSVALPPEITSPSKIPAGMPAYLSTTPPQMNPTMMSQLNPTMISSPRFQSNIGPVPFRPGVRY